MAALSSTSSVLASSHQRNAPTAPKVSQSPVCLPIDTYWRRTRPTHWLFPGPDPSRHLTPRWLQHGCREAADAAGLSKSVTVHTLRHSFATHLPEQGVDIRVIQDLLGHRQITSTTRYARVAINTIRHVQSSLERLNMDDAPPA